MPTRRPVAAAQRPSEEGFVLLIAIFLLALLVLSLSVAAPRMIKQIQRDRDVETMHRGKQYQRAVQLYYRKFGAYPPNIDALVKSNNIRFLRKRYIDPITGKDDWKPILWGQNKTPTAMGFFGQPLTGSTMAGVGPSGGNSAGNGLGNGTTGGLNGANSIFGSDTSTTSTASAAGSSGSSATGAPTGSAAGAAGTDATGSNGTGSAAGSSGTNGTGGQTFGGAGIIGFEPGSPKESILIYKKKNHYNEWEFTYDPLQDRMTMQGGNSGNSGVNGQPAGSNSAPFGSNTSGASSIGAGSSNGAGSSGSSSTTTSPTAPPQ